MKKAVRYQVYRKYNGCCAYCGKKILYQDMQVDHVKPKKLGGTNDIDNLLPACRLCNHYKRAATLHDFKHWLLAGILERLRKIYIFRVAERYGMVSTHAWDKKFYFEKMEDNRCDEKKLPV